MFRWPDVAHIDFTSYKRPVMQVIRQGCQQVLRTLRGLYLYLYKLSILNLFF